MSSYSGKVSLAEAKVDAITTTNVLYIIFCRIAHRSSMNNHSLHLRKDHLTNTIRIDLMLLTILMISKKIFTFFCDLSQGCEGFSADKKEFHLKMRVFSQRFSFVRLTTILHILTYRYFRLT
uniref:Uncharacterized protein n=1 Tax=Parascaris equorum TaxID=6256 RepID=A0A914SB53_PAREQ